MELVKYWAKKTETTTDENGLETSKFSFFSKESKDITPDFCVIISEEWTEITEQELPEDLSLLKVISSSRTETNPLAVITEYSFTKKTVPDVEKTPAVCAKCIHVKKDTNFYECTAKKVLNHITGDEMLVPCCLRNLHGECRDFEVPAEKVNPVIPEDTSSENASENISTPDENKDTTSGEIVNDGSGTV